MATPRTPNESNRDDASKRKSDANSDDYAGQIDPSVGSSASSGIAGLAAFVGASAEDAEAADVADASDVSHEEAVGTAPASQATTHSETSPAGSEAFGIDAPEPVAGGAPTRNTFEFAQAEAPSVEFREVEPGEEISAGGAQRPPEVVMPDAPAGAAPSPSASSSGDDEESVEDTPEEPMPIETWSPQGALSGSVLEDAAAGDVIAVLPSEDQYGEPITYALTDSSGQPLDSGLFVLDGNVVRLAPGAELDFETASDLSLYVTATNDGGTSGPWGVSVTVGDVAEEIKLGDGGEVFVERGVTESSVTGGDGADTIVGGDENDQLSGWSGNDVMSAGDGDDSLYGGGGDDTLVGGDGDDLFTGWSGDDVVQGGAGTDVMVFRGSIDDYAISYDSASDTFVLEDLNGTDGLDEGRDTVTGVERFVFDDANLSKDDLIAVVEDRENSAPSSVSLDSGGTVAENSDGGTVVATLTATDADGDAISFTITDFNGNPIDDSNFEIVGNEVRVKDGADLNFEEATSHGIYVIASDGSDASAPSLVTLTVSDVAENLTLEDGGERFDETGVKELSVTGGSGDDTIIGGDHTDIIDGGAGDDFIEAGEELNKGDDDVIRGGDGNDTIVSSETDSLSNDRLYGDEGNDNISSQGGADTLEGGSGNDTLSSGTGDDRLVGGTGDDEIDGGAGSDTAVYSGELADFQVVFDEATQTFTLTDLNSVDGDEGVDTVTGVERFEFGGATYTLDELKEEADRQANTAPEGATVASGGSVAENSAAGTVVAVLDASDVDGDTLTYVITDSDGNPIDDSNFEIVGDEVRVKDGASLDYETANTLQVYVTVMDDYTASEPRLIAITVTDDAEDIQLANGGQTFADSGVAEASITGGTGADTISGMDDGAVIDGGAGNDSITGGAGSDSLVGGAGNDRIFFGDGSDTVYGGDGNDYIDDAPGNPSTTGGDYVDAGAGNDRVWAGDGDDTLLGGDGNDYVNGQNGADSIDGGAGNDTLNGESGNDTLDGGDGNDGVYGGSGDDVLIGGSGADTLNGSSGDDTIDGGANGAGPNTVVRMDFDADSAGVAADTSGNNYDGMYRGNATPGATGWNGEGTAVSLDGSGDYIEVPDQSDFDLAEGTVSLRFNADNLNGTQALVSRDATNFEGGGHFRLVLKNDGSLELRMQSDSGSNTIRTDSNLIDPNTWHHVAVGFGPDGMQIYVDGALVETGSYTGGIAGNDEQWTLGADQWQSSAGTTDNLNNFFEGSLDEFSVFDAQLDGADVATLASDGVDGLYEPDTAIYAGPLSDFGIVYDDATQTFTITDLNRTDGYEGVDTVTGVERFVFDGVTYTVADLKTEADRQANTAPGTASIASGGDVAENSAAGTVVGTLTATDPDGDTLTYVITDADGNPISDSNFEIVGNEIRVKDGADLDYEGATTHDIYVAVADDFETSSPERITVTVTDEAEHIQLADGGVYFADSGVKEASVTGGTGDDTIVGTDGKDSLVGGAGNDELSGGNNKDTLIGGAGNDFMDGGLGSDTFVFESGFGNDTVQAQWGWDKLDFSAIETDMLVDFTADEVGVASTGSDSVAFDDIERIDTGSGNDTINASVMLDGTYSTGAGDDSITAGTGDDFIDAGSGNDYLNGGAGNDTLIGGAGDDTLEGGQGEDIARFAGNLADYQITYDQASGQFTIVDLNGADGDDGTDTVRDVELFEFADGTYTENDLVQIYGTDADDAPDNPDTTTSQADSTFEGGNASGSITFGNSDDVAYGFGGNDTMDGAGGNDKIDGGSGNDILYGWTGDDTLYGGSGNDSMTGEDGADVLYGDSGDDLMYGGNGSDVMRGGTGNDTAYGGNEADLMYGDAGHDSFHGQAGNDTMYGGSGNDYLDGGTGNDTLHGGLGNDTMVGGDGSDTFIIASLEGIDVVSGGDAGGWTDVIVLEGMGSGVTVDGNTVTGDGWTMVLDSGHTVQGQGLDSVELSPDAIGTITFDDGGVIDFTGIERVDY